MQVVGQLKFLLFFWFFSFLVVFCLEEGYFGLFASIRVSEDYLRLFVFSFVILNNIIFWFFNKLSGEFRFE